MPFTVAIVGRPNVGKSTLFNRLAGRRLAIVHDRPGVTRDRREGQGHLAGMSFTVIDTAGLEEAGSETLEGRMRLQTERAVTDADVALMLIDARAGVTPMDRHFADLLRRGPTPVLLVANKCEGAAGKPGLYEAWSLGLGDPIPLSAEHGEGLADLAQGLFPLHDACLAADEGAGADDEATLPGDGEDELTEDADDGPRVNEPPLTVAVVGRPNVGKSTLINRLLGEDRLVVGPEAGITRDAIVVEWQWRGRPIRLVDTAGIRRRTRVTDSLEQMSVASSLDAVNHAQVVVLLLDANAVLEKQELTIARRVIDEGRALVVAVNKWDIAEDRAASLERLKDRLQTSLPQVQGLPTVTLSAETGQGMDKLLGSVLSIYETWTRRVSTSALNRWLEAVLDHHPPPVGKHGRRIRLRYMTQTTARPPTFVAFCSRPEDLPDAYVRYLVNSLRQQFTLPGVPVRLYLRRTANPYARDEG